MCARRMPRRGADRVQTVAGWTLVAAALLTALLTVSVGAAAYRDALDRVHRDAAERTVVDAVLLEDTPARTGAIAWAPVRYVDRTGEQRTGRVPVVGTRPAGSTVPVELDGTGRAGVDRLSRGDAVLSGIAAGSGVVVVGGLLLVLAWLAVRRAVAAAKAASWEREWARVEPEWSGRS